MAQIHKFMKKAGCKTEAEFYKKHPDEQSYFKAHPEDRKKADAGIQLPDDPNTIINRIKNAPDQRVNATPGFDINGKQILNNDSTTMDDIANGRDMTFSRIDASQQPPVHANQGLPGVTPDVIDQYHPIQNNQSQNIAQDTQAQGPQPAQKPTGKPVGNFNFNTADAFAVGIQGLNGALKWQKPKENKNPYQMAVNSFPNGTGSHASFKKGGKMKKCKDGDKIKPVIQEGFFPQHPQPVQVMDSEPHYYAPQLQQPVQGQYNPPTPMMPLGFDSRLPQVEVGFKKAAKGIHIKPENRGKFNATKKATGKTTEELTHSSNPVTKKRAIFAQNAAKWHHADAGTSIPNNWQDNWNAYRTYASTLPGFGTDQWNHGTQGMQSMQNWNINNPNQQIPTDVNYIQQTMQDKSQQYPGSVKAPLGLSKVDNYAGQKTTNPLMTTYGQQWNKWETDPITHQRAEKTYAQENYGTHVENWKQRDQFQPVAQPVQEQPITTNTGGWGGNGGNPNYKEGMTYSQVTGNSSQPQQAKTQNPNWHTDEATDYFANGGMIPTGMGDLQIQGKYNQLSPNTIELKDSSHKQGGQLIAANGTTVEAEGPSNDNTGDGETIHISPVDGSVNVGGNQYIGNSDIKFKTAFKQLGRTEDNIARVQAKNQKQKDKTLIIANNITDPTNRYGAPTAGTVSVMADAHAQRDAEVAQVADKVAQTKQYLTDMQNAQLEASGKARKGMKIPMAKTGKRLDPITGEPVDYNTNPPKSTSTGRPYKKVTGTTTTPQQNYIEPAGQRTMDIPGNSNVGWPGLPSDALPDTTPQPQAIEQPYTRFNQRMPQDIPGVTSQYPEGQTPYPGGLGGESPVTTERNRIQSEDSPYGKDYNWFHDPFTQGPAQKPAFKQGLRNKFHIGDYLGEIMAGFDKPEPVQSMQVNPILEPEYNLSLQQKKNSIISAYKPALQGAVNSTGQQAAIAGQMAEQLGAVDSEELGLNQQNQGAIRARNLQELHSTRDTNTQLAMQQLNQQAQAKSVTEQNRFNAAQSISHKEAQRRAENNKLGMYEQATGWSWDPNSHQYQMLHPGYQFNDIGVHQFNPDTEPDKKTKNKYYRYDPRTGKKLSESDETIYDNNRMMGGMVGGPMPGMATAPVAMRKKKAAKGTKLKYC
jgi:hypothetical protein